MQDESAYIWEWWDGTALRTQGSSLRKASYLSIVGLQQYGILLCISWLSRLGLIIENLIYTSSFSKMENFKNILFQGGGGSCALVDFI